MASFDYIKPRETEQTSFFPTLARLTRAWAGVRCTNDKGRPSGVLAWLENESQNRPREARLIHLAIQTDSTRLLRYHIRGPTEVPQIPGINLGYHNLSHHGKDPAKIKQLTIVATEHMKALSRFLRRLKETKEQDASLLDRTMVLFGSAMGNTSSHTNKNLPIIFASGDFKHGRRLAFDADTNYPLANPYVTMLQRLGLEVDAFASSTGTMTGLE